MPEVQAPELFVEVEPEPILQKPADPTETTSTMQEPVTLSPPPIEAPAEIVARPSHVKVDAEIKDGTMPKLITPIGQRRAMTVQEMLPGPMNRKVYYVDGDTIVNDEFSKGQKALKRPPRITPTEWQNAGKSR